MPRSSFFQLLLTLVLVGCNGGGGDGSSLNSNNDNGNKKYRIAVIPKGTTHDFWKSVHFGAKKAAEELGNVEIIWQGPTSESDKEGQIKICDTFIGRKVDGICLAPIDRDGLVQVVKRARQREIPTIIFDSGLSDHSEVVSYVATDNFNGGKMAGEHLVEKMENKGGAILLRYQAGSESTEQREAGFMEAIKAHPEITILSDNQRVRSDTDEALKISENLLREHKDVKGVFTVCEPVNKGMLQALKNESMAGKVRFIAFDSDPSVIEGLKNGSVDGVVLQDPVNMGYLAVKTMVEYLEGKEVKKRISTGETLVTPENMDKPEIQKLLRPEKQDN